MPGIHNENTKLIGFFADDALKERIDQAAKKAGVIRSQFLRDAVCDHIESLDIHVPAHLRLPPPRAGKGGPRRTIAPADRKRFPSPPQGSSPQSSESSSAQAPQGQINSDPNLAAKREAAAISKKAEDQHMSGHQVSRRSHPARGPISGKGQPSRGASQESKNKPSPQEQAPE